jgi:hypothetical protein
VAKNLPNIGMIISLKEEYEGYRTVQKHNLPNLMLKSFVPQKQLLNDDRIKAFITHCGANSINEALYFGKPLIGFPLKNDQIGNAYKLVRMGVGISLSYDSRVDYIEKAIIKLVKEGDKHDYHKNIKRVQKKIEFMELRSGQDFGSLMRKTVSYHEWSEKEYSKHLFNGSVYNNMPWSTYDYDIKLTCILLTSCVLYFISILYKARR